MRPSLCLLLPLLFASIACSLVAPQAAGGSDEVSLLQQGVSLLQRSSWASPPNPHAMQLTGQELTTYIATGRLPAQVLAQLQQPNTSSAGASSEDVEKKELSAYARKADKLIGEMKTDEEKLDNVRLVAETAYMNFTEQETRLSDNFRNVSKTINALIQRAAHDASKAEVKTMIERLRRIHYKQIGTLDRSATYWIEVAEKEKEATRVAKANGRLEAAKAGAKIEASSVELNQMEKARAKEKAELDEWFKQHWAKLENSEKEALEKEALIEEDEEKELEEKEWEKLNKKEPCSEVPATEEVWETVVPATPGQIIPHSIVVKSDADVERSQM